MQVLEEELENILLCFTLMIIRVHSSITTYGSLYFLNCFCHTKIELLEEREVLEQPWKQEQLLKRVPLVRAELLDSEDEQHKETQL